MRTPYILLCDQHFQTRMFLSLLGQVCAFAILCIISSNVYQLLQLVYQVYIRCIHLIDVFKYQTMLNYVANILRKIYAPNFGYIVACVSVRRLCMQQIYCQKSLQPWSILRFHSTNNGTKKTKKKNPRRDYFIFLSLQIKHAK